MELNEMSWLGYARKNGAKGIRNRLLVIYTVKCSEFVARRICEKAAHPDVYAAYQKLIALKKGCSGLHVGADGNMSLSMAKVDQGKAEWAFEGTFDGANKRFKVAVTNGNGGGKTADFAGYELYLDSLGELTSLSTTTSLEPYQVVVGVQAA